jgi:hypothetical protein
MEAYFFYACPRDEVERHQRFCRWTPSLYAHECSCAQEHASRISCRHHSSGSQTRPGGALSPLETLQGGVLWLIGDLCSWAPPLRLTPQKLQSARGTRSPSQPPTDHKTRQNHATGCQKEVENDAKEKEKEKKARPHPDEVLHYPFGDGPSHPCGRRAPATRHVSRNPFVDDAPHRVYFIVINRCALVHLVVFLKFD